MAGVLLWARSEIRDGWRSLIVVGVLIAVVVGSVLALAPVRSAPARHPTVSPSDRPGRDRRVHRGEAPADLVDEIAADPRIERVVVSTVAKIGAERPAGPGLQRDHRSGRIPLGGYGRPLLISGRYPGTGQHRRDPAQRARGELRAGIAVGDRVPLSALPCLEGARRCASETPWSSASSGCSDDLVDDPGGAAPHPRRTDAGRRSVAPGGAAGHDPVAACGRRRRPGRSSPPTSRPTSAPSATPRTRRLTRDGRAGGRAAARRVAPGSPPSPPSPGAVVVAQAVAAAPPTATERCCRPRCRRPRPPAADVAAAVAAVLPAVLAGRRRRGRRRCRGQPGVPARCRPPRRAAGRVSASTRPCSSSEAALAVAAVIGIVRRRCDPGWARTTQPPTPAGRSAVATLIERLRLRPAAATGARFALDAGHGAQRLPVIPTLADRHRHRRRWRAAAIVVHTNLDRTLTTPARFGQPWDFAVSGTVEARGRHARAGRRPPCHGGRPRPPGRARCHAPGRRNRAVEGHRHRWHRRTDVARVRSGRAPVGIEEVALAGETMAELGVAIGDRVELSGPCAEQLAEVVGEAIAPIVDQGDPGEGIVLSLAGSTPCAPIG